MNAVETIKRGSSELYLALFFNPRERVDPHHIIVTQHVMHE